MESAQSSCQFPEPKRKPADARQQPLWIRLYFRPHMTEIARLLGYGDIPLDSIGPQIAALVEQYGQETIDAAREEIMDVVEVRQTFARLKQGVRQIARQLLGPPPNPGAQPVPDVSQAMPPPPAPPSAIANDESGRPLSSHSEDAPPEGTPSPDGEEQYLAAYEAHEGQLYCCDRPKLTGTGRSTIFLWPANRAGTSSSPVTSLCPMASRPVSSSTPNRNAPNPSPQPRLPRSPKLPILLGTQPTGGECR